jgi:hypothetical protein
MTEKEAEWWAAEFALLLMQEADRFRCDEEENPTGGDWRSIAARVACLERLGSDMPQGVRAWVEKATAYLDKGDRLAPAFDTLLFDRGSSAGVASVYRAFREAYSRANPELRQRLAAAQDVFRGRDYYACEEYMIEADENSPTYTGPVYAAESFAHCEIIRDIFGDPSAPVAFSPAWRTDVAVTLARTMYESRDFSAMPILADAIQDAGCDNEEVLNHCRDTSLTHVRGCWVTDLVLGKS